MKRNLLLVLMILPSIVLFSQNWAPINSTEKFCYSSDDTLEIINNVLWVDSTKQMSDHEIYYFNKTVAPCDTCAEPYFMLMNQPQFLLDYAKVYNNGEWVFINENGASPIYDSFRLYPYESLGFQWDFNENITAEITFEYTAYPIFEGVNDQVKVICLSDQACILLSENHGIINWGEEYLLVGIEGRDLGITVPKFDDMFAEINIGDILCYYTYSAEASKNVEFRHNYLRYEVSNIERHEDSVIFEASYYRKYTEFEYGKSDEVSYGDTLLFFYPNLFTEFYPNEVIPQYDWFDEICISNMAFDKWGGLARSNSVVLSDNGFLISSYVPDEEEPELLSPLYDLNYSHYQYSINYGFMECEIAGFEWSYSNQIIGYLHNGDTLGEIYPVDMFVGNLEIDQEADWQVYPNPAKNLLNISSSQMGNLEYQIYHISGQLVAQASVDKRGVDLKIQVADLNKGIYIIEIKINEEILQKKWIKN